MLDDGQANLSAACFHRLRGRLQLGGGSATRFPPFRDEESFGRLAAWRGVDAPIL